MANPVPTYPSDSAIQALANTRHDETAFKFVPKSLTDSSTPSYYVQFMRELLLLQRILTAANEGRVVSDGSLTFGVNAISFRIAGADKSFGPVTAQAVADDSTTYVWLDSTPALQTGGAFPGDLTTFMPLAKIVTASGSMTITDERRRVFYQVDQLAGTYANAALDNLAGVDINASLLVDTDDGYDLGSAAKAWRIAYLKTGLIFLGAANNLTITPTEPSGGSRVLTIPQMSASDDMVLKALSQVLSNKELVDANCLFQDDADATKKMRFELSGITTGTTRILTVPDADDTIVGLAATQTLTNKTLTTPTIASLTNIQHDHSDAGGGGNLDETSHGTGKYCPYAPHFYISGALSAKVYEIEFVAPFAFTFRNAHGRVNTAPTGDDLIIDIRKNGASFFSAQAEMVFIADGTQADTSSTKDAAVAAGDIITIQVEQVGSGVAGSDLTLVLNCLAALDAV